jgi:hypothetical protein
MRGLLFEHDAQFRVIRDLETEALVAWKAPATTSEHCTIPAGVTLRLRYDVPEPVEQVHYESIDRPNDAPHGVMVFEAALAMGFEDVTKQPDKWRKVTWFGAHLDLVAEDHAELEAQLIPESTRTHPKYNGAWFSLPLTCVGDAIDYIATTPEPLVTRRQSLYVTEAFEAHGLRADMLGTQCRIPSETILKPGHTIDTPHLVTGWELQHEQHTWWLADRDVHNRDRTEYVRTDRVCPSHFVATCDPSFATLIESEIAWDAMLIPTELIGRKITTV